MVTDSYDPAEWDDFDNDTYGDNSDVFPSNPAEWNDTDGDTVGDNSDAFPASKRVARQRWRWLWR